MIPSHLRSIVLTLPILVTLPMTLGQGCVSWTPLPLQVGTTSLPATVELPASGEAATENLEAVVFGGTGPYTYIWTSMPSVAIAGATSPTARASLVSTGTYTFTVAVSDSLGGVATSSTTTTVTQPSLRVDAGADQTVQADTDVMLTATATGGTGTFAFLWTKVTGVNGSPDSPSAISTAVPTTTVGSTTYRVTVTDSGQPPASATDWVVVTVAPSPLTVTAGAAPSVVALSATTTLHANPSGGTPPYSFSWSQAGGPSATMNGLHSQNAVAGFSSANTYVFTVTVVDSGSPAQTAVSSPVGVIARPDTPATDGTNDTITVDLPGNVPLVLVKIPAGTFQMGDISGNGERDERPVHTVTLSRPFYIGRYEVTQAQWRAVMNSDPSYFTGDQRPVERVTWADVQAFCQTVRTRTNVDLRLPTEAEWEYACRAGSGSDYSFGDSIAQLTSFAWYYSNSNLETRIVGEKLPNDRTLYDMHGNVWEWCQDMYGSYSSENQTDPTGSSSGTSPVVRGGCFSSTAGLLRCAYRKYRSPNIRYNDVGFRLALGTR